MRPLLALAFVLAAASPVPAVVHADDGVGTRRLFTPGHELGVVGGTTGLLIGAGAPRPSLVGVTYEENAGVVGEFLVYGLARLLGLTSGSHSTDRRTFTTHVAVRGYFPAGDGFAGGGEFSFGGNVRLFEVQEFGPMALSFAVRVGFLAEGSRQAAMDALTLRMHAPVFAEVSMFMQFDANLYALLDSEKIRKWWRPSPVTLGFQYDVTRMLWLRAEGSFVFRDVAGQLSGGLRI